jgi:hypothetical protein
VTQSCSAFSFFSTRSRPLVLGARPRMGDRGGRRHERNGDHRSKQRDGERDWRDSRERDRSAGSLARMERSDRCVRAAPRHHPFDERLRLECRRHRPAIQLAGAPGDTSE